MDDECSGRALGWDAASESTVATPKLEPVEDRVNLNEVSEAPRAPRSTTTNVLSREPKAKRPRGRPRKHPIVPAPTSSKVAKGRSKTGCITCRKRKKKCDEAKPRCMNCEKNAVVCEGYHEKKLWRGGRDKSDEDKREAPFHFTMQSLFHGVTECEDRIFWKHYCASLSNVLTVEGETRNAFKDIILPLANQHQGVMHSILSMSSKHIDYDTPYGSKLLEQNPTVSQESLELRSSYHHDKAIESFHADARLSSEDQDVDHETVLRARYAQMLCLLIGTLIEGNARGDHRIHLRGYQLLIQHSPPKDSAFLAFITEFFQYHVFADELIRHPSMTGPRLIPQEWLPSIPTEQPRLLGVADGLLSHLPQISTIKDTIRRNISQGVETRVDYHLLWRAQEIQEAIEQWSPQWPAGDKRHNVGLIYKHMMFLHLFRTIYPPTTSDQQRPASYFFPGGEPVSPAASRRPSQPSRPLTASSSASSPGDQQKMTFAAQTTVQQRSPPGSRNPSRTSSMHETDQASLSTQQRPLSPPPSRRASHHDARIAVVVEESLAMMESFKPFEPALALLLMPCLIIGAACFESAQRERTRTVIKQIRGYTGLRNCDRVRELLEEIWSLMDERDWISVWDWQSVARGLEVDFLCT